MAKKRGLLFPRGKNLTSERAQGAIKALCVQTKPFFDRQRAQILRVDAWTKGEQYDLTSTVSFDSQQVEGRPFMPRSGRSDEVGDLATRAPAPWGKLIVSSLAQTIYWESARVSGMAEDAEMDCWSVLQENNWGSKQIPHTRATIGHGISYVRALPAKSPLTGEKSANIKALSGLTTFCSYDESDDDWPAFAIEVEDVSFADVNDQEWTNIKFTDDVAMHSLKFKNDGSDIEDYVYNGVLIEHETGVCPYVRYANLMDLDGNAMGEISPIIPLLRRIDQDTFDRLVVQRFGAWKVRYIAGMAEPDTDEKRRAQAMVLRAQDILIASDPDTHFGTLDETPLDGFISATDADLRVLAAVTQTPPHHLLGLSSNLQAEALAAAEGGLQRKSTDYKIYSSSSNTQLLRLIAIIRGKYSEASARTIDIRYRDTESRSFVQAASALTTLATGLKIPVEMLWTRVPGWTDEDSSRAKKLIEQGTLDALFQTAQDEASAQSKQIPEAQGHNGASAQE